MAGPTGIPGMRGPGGAGRANMRGKAEEYEKYNYQAFKIYVGD